VPVLCARVVALLRHSKSPASLSARRCLVEDWYAKTLSRVPPGSIADERERRDALDSSSELVPELQVFAFTRDWSTSRRMRTNQPSFYCPLPPVLPALLQY